MGVGFDGSISTRYHNASGVFVLRRHSSLFSLSFCAFVLKDNCNLIWTIDFVAPFKFIKISRAFLYLMVTHAPLKRLI